MLNVLTDLMQRRSREMERGGRKKWYERKTEGENEKVGYQGRDMLHLIKIMGIYTSFILYTFL